MASLVLVDEGEDGYVVFAPHRSGDDGVRVVDDLLQGADRHGRATQLVHLYRSYRSGLAGFN